MSPARATTTEVAGLDRAQVPPDPGPVADGPDRRARAHHRRLIVATAAADLVAWLAAVTVALATNGTAPPWLAVVITAMGMGTFALYDLYDRRRLASPAEEARRIFTAVTVCVVAVVVGAFSIEADLGRGLVATLWLACLAAVGVTRLAARKTIHRLRRRGHLLARALVVGTNEEALLLARILTRQAWQGYSVGGFVSTGSGGGGDGGAVEGWPVLGSVAEVREAVERIAAAAVIVAGSAVGPDEVLALEAALAPLDVDVRISPGLPHVAASRIALEPLDGLALLSVTRRQFTWREAAAKRAFDVACAGLLLAFTLPLQAIVAVVVRATSRGPALFRQVRTGKDGRPFVMLKFRTMVVDAQLRLAELRPVNEADGLLFKLRHDPRITRPGRVLRRFALDELPQLWNVLRGHMSMVGPRPALPEETEVYCERLRQRLRVKPGLTGLWQVSGRHELAFAEYLHYDAFYIDNWTFGLDLYVIARTIPAMLSGRGSY